MMCIFISSAMCLERQFASHDLQVHPSVLFHLQDADLCQKDADLCQKRTDLCQKDADLCQKRTDLCQKDADLCQKRTDLCQKDADLCQKEELNWIIVINLAEPISVSRIPDLYIPDLSMHCCSPKMH